MLWKTANLVRKENKMCIVLIADVSSKWREILYFYGEIFHEVLCYSYVNIRLSVMSTWPWQKKRLFLVHIFLFFKTVIEDFLLSLLRVKCMLFVEMTPILVVISIGTSAKANTKVARPNSQHKLRPLNWLKLTKTIANSRTQIMTSNKIRKLSTMLWKVKYFNRFFGQCNTYKMW